MDHFPTGNVTFLFTDIEGSTRLAQKDNDAYLDALALHHEILYEVIDSNKGFVFKIIGDSFCCAFNSSEDAVNAAVKTQIKLRKTEWEGMEIKVRMGIHSGEAEFVNGDYVGYVTLSRSQRIMSSAYGGQILVTDGVYHSVKENPEVNVTFKDFGKRKLKDIILPEHIYQVIAEGIESDFMPLKSLDARQNNLPSIITKFIGRQKELNEIKNLFPGVRMISLTGAGGTGKTRLALQLASEMVDEYENGVWIIELSAINDPELIIKEITITLGLKEDPTTDIFETLKSFLKSKKILLLLDNTEHLLNKCAKIAEDLLSYCPNLKIISTSRESFNIPGETIYRVPPLSMPEKIENETYETLCQYESVKFFYDRAVSVNSNFQLTKENIHIIAELCKKLDGIPLAIELASKRMNVLTAEKILERLSDRFKLLTSGNTTALPRQKTLRAMIDWSYDMLNPNEQLMLQRLSIFMGGWTLESAEQICSDENIDEYEVLDMMNSLLDKSLIIYKETNGKGRYDILESIKYYGLEKLGGKKEEFQKNLDFFLIVSSFIDQKKKGMGELDWLKMMEDELDNIRMNIQWAEANNPDSAVLLVINTFDFWYSKGYFQEGYETSLKFLHSVNPVDKKSKAELLYCIAQLCYHLGKFDELEKYATEGLNLSREIEYKKGIIKCLNTISLKAYTELDNESAVKYNEESLALSIEINDDKSKINSLYNLSFPIGHLGDYDRSIALKEEALQLARKLNNEHFIAQVLLSLSVSQSGRKGDIKKAAVLSEESLILSRKLEDLYLISINLVNLAALKLYYEEKNYEEAEYLLHDAYNISIDHGYNMNLFPIRIHLGLMYVETGKFSEAITVFNEYLKEKDKPGAEFFMNNLIAGIGKICFKSNEYKDAVRLYGLIDFMSSNKKYKSVNKNLILSVEDKTVLVNSLGEDEFNKYWNEGRTMNFDEALIESMSKIKNMY